MPKPVKKRKTTYEAFVWDGANQDELRDFNIYNTEVTTSVFGGRALSVYFYDEKDDYVSEWLSVGDAIVRSSKGKIWYLNQYDYKEKFEDA